MHVDDGLVTGNKEDLINDFIHQFEQELNEIKVFKPIEKYLGMEVTEDDNRVYIHFTEKVHSRRCQLT